jgi:hypothetical protein
MSGTPGTVGRNARNYTEDVRLVQQAVRPQGMGTPAMASEELGRSCLSPRGRQRRNKSMQIPPSMHGLPGGGGNRLGGMED